MLTFIFMVLMVIVFGKILLFAIKATWGLAKILFSVVMLPLVLIGLVLTGLVTVALPILVVLGIFSFIFLHD